MNMPYLSRRSMLALGAAAAGSVALSGCGGGGASNSGTASFWNFYGENPSGSAESEWMTKLISDWNANNDFQVSLKYMPAQTYLDGSTLQTAFTSGEGPDVFLLSPGDFLRYANGGVLRDLSDKLDNSVRADFTPGFLESRSDGDKLYAIPMDAEPLAIFYSPAAFEAGGLSEGDIPTTWEEFVAVAEKLTTDRQFGAMVDPAPSYYENFTWYPFLWQTGNDVFDADGKPAFDNPGSVQAMQLWQDLIYGGLAPKQAQGAGASEVNTNLGSGNVAMQQSGIWGIAQMAQNLPDFEYDVFPLPIPDGGTPTTIVGGWSFAVNAEGKDPDGAADFVTWALASQEKEQIQRLVDWTAGAKSNFPTRKSVLEAAEQQGKYEEAHMKKFVDEIYPTGVSEPRFPPEVYKPISDALQAVALEGKDAQEQVSAAQASLEKYMESYDGVKISY
ncbi:MAG: sugar ABC transporter substrate-binding protein [Corynebacteriales bacterium]|nr:sugar ABC transporter substrate-binding protein [Actinomyces urogenitalis]MBS6415497.1 sugar ABC transporter substrate-binding protein [Mycobacteriales bacterium]MDU0864190.1 sugar ABC transporter substrate-binding protein [Actinomyces urogenitalis]